MRKKRNAFSSKPKVEEKASRLEQLVNEVMIQKKLNSEKRFSTISEHRYSGSLQETIVGFPHDNIYNHSYQEALNRYHIKLRNTYLQTSLRNQNIYIIFKYI